MINLFGKNNIARIYSNYLDEETEKQIKKFINCKVSGDACHIAIMPDCHAGKGSCIGFTCELSSMIVPNIVGVDIGCGILAYRLPIDKMDFAEFDQYVRESVPCGHDVHDNLFLIEYFLREENVISYRNDFIEMAKRVGQKEGRTIESLGTLGGGNHFIEIDKEENGTLWLIVHSGSRNLGAKVAEYHQKIAEQYIEEIDESVPKGLEYLEGDKAKTYIHDMKLCQEYARLNRLFIIKKLATFFDINSYDVLYNDCIESVHNYIDFDDEIIRKGAIPAYRGQNVIIPINSRDGTIIGEGLNNCDWNYSAPHGAGRCKSRTKAKEQISVEKYKKDMEDVWTSCVDEGTLDEAPDAYKSMDEIMGILEQTVIPRLILKPVYNFKSGSKNRQNS